MKSHLLKGANDTGVIPYMIIIETNPPANRKIRKKKKNMVNLPEMDMVLRQFHNLTH